MTLVRPPAPTRPSPDRPPLEVRVLSYRGSVDAIRWGDVEVIERHTAQPPQGVVQECHRRRFL